MSNLSAIEYVTSPSALTTGLFNQRYSVISANFAALNSQQTLSLPSGNTVSILTNLEVVGGAHFQFISVGSTPPSYVTTAAITVAVNSAYSDYLYLTDSSGQRSNYIIGSRAGGTADGLNIWDASGATLLATFSKQSIRFWQNVFAPVFDAGGATFNVKSYGARGDGATDDTVAFQLAISAVSALNGGVVLVPSSQSAYIISSTLTLVPNLTVMGSAGFNPTLQFSGGSGILFSFLGTAEAQAFNTKIQNLTLFNPSTNGVAIRLRNFENAYLDQLVLSNWSLGIWTDWGIGTYVDQCQISHTNRGIMAGGKGLAGGIRQSSSSQSAFMDTVVISETVFAQNKYDVVHHGSMFAEGVLVLRECSFFEDATAPVSGKTENVHLSNLKSAHITGNWFENPLSGRNSIVFTNADSDGTTYAGLGCRGGFVAGNDFLSVGTNNDMAGVLLESCGGITVTGNNFEFSSSAGTPVVISERTTPNAIIANNYLTWSDSTNVTNPILSFNSIHMILELSNKTSSLGTTIFAGVVSVQTGTSALPSITVGSNRSVGFYSPANNQLNVVGLSGGMGINMTQGVAATLDVNGTGLFHNNLDIMGVSAVSDGAIAAPSMSFRSETPLGWYRSANSTMALSYGSLILAGGTSFSSTGFAIVGSGMSLGRNGTFGNLNLNPTGGNFVDLVLASAATLRFYDGGFINANMQLSNVGVLTTRAGIIVGSTSVAHPAGTALQPSVAFSSESSLGLYRSGNSTMVLSYGTIDLTASGAVTSIASLTIKSGSNNACGTAVLGSNGSVNVANTYVKTGDLIFLTDQTPGGTLGDLEILGIRNSSGFTIGSTSITDTSTIAWLIVRPG